MTRYHLKEGAAGTLIKKLNDGMAVEQIDTITGRAKIVERPKTEAVEYITDGIGNVRIKGSQIKKGSTELDSGKIEYFYQSDNDWLSMGRFDYANRIGFNPNAVDPKTDRVYGFAPNNGRQALISFTLDGSGEK